MYAVYALIDPRDDAVRYVGMTNDVYARFSQHVRCEGNNITKNMWITELRELNQMVIMRTIETVETLEEVRSREAYWIQQYLSQGSDLFNLTGSKSITFDEFMSFFRDNTEDNSAIDDEVQQSEIVTPSPSRQVKKRGSRLSRNLYTSSEAARIVKCSVSEIKAALDHGHLQTAKNSDKILKSSLEKFIQEMREKRAEKLSLIK